MAEYSDQFSIILRLLFPFTPCILNKALNEIKRQGNYDGYKTGIFLIHHFFYSRERGNLFPFANLTRNILLWLRKNSKKFLGYDGPLKILKIKKKIKIPQFRGNILKKAICTFIRQLQGLMTFQFQI